MLQVRPWTNVILHLDGDAFFASVVQAVNPSLKGKPVVTGKERGIATAVSYEAKKYGITRGMRIFEIKKICPLCQIIDSDYDMYQLFSNKMFNILHSFTPFVEEYSIDEAFADIKGLRRPYNMSYLQIGKSIKNKIESSLGITVSVGISITKSLAKIASSFQKPSGLTVINGSIIEKFLKNTPIEKVWGIGENTSAYLKKFEVNNAFDFISKPESFVKKNLSKPFWEIWQELRGNKVYEIDISGKSSYKSISKTQTFNPPTNNRDILWAKLLNHIEDAFNKARGLNYKVGRLIVFLKSQQFQYFSIEIKPLKKTYYPLLIREDIKKGFEKIYQKEVIYRSTGCLISNFEENNLSQMTLFEENTSLENKAAKIYPLYEKKKVDFGTILFDKDRLDEKKKKIGLKIPFLETF